MNRNSRFWLLLAGALVVVVLLVGGAGGDGPPYDPRSVNPDGARGLVESLERAGARVDLDAPVPDPMATTALILQDRLTSDDQTKLRGWVRSGGVLVVADQTNDLAARSLGVIQPRASSAADETPRITRDRCSIEALADVDSLRTPGRLLDAFGVASCFGDGNRAFVVAEQVGSGTVVTIGSPDVFTNRLLGEDDAAVLALSLLAPQRDRSHVSVIGPSVVDFGDESLTDLVPPRVRNAILQLLAAFLFYALYRSRRLGGVVAEPLPVHIEGSELVLKAGLLSERAKDPTSAAQLLRNDVAHRARRALSIPATADSEALIERIASRTALEPEQLYDALVTPVSTDGDLTRITQLLSELDRQLYDTSTTETRI